MKANVLWRALHRGETLSCAVTPLYSHSPSILDEDAPTNCAFGGDTVFDLLCAMGHVTNKSFSRCGSNARLLPQIAQSMVLQQRCWYLDMLLA